MYEEMLISCEETSSEPAKTNRNLILCGVNLSFLKRTANNKTSIINPREDRDFLIVEPPGVTNKLFNRNLIGDARFPEGLKWEDYPFTIPLTIEANQIAIVPERHYTYNMHLNNTTLTDARKLSKNILDIFTCYDMIGTSCLPAVNDNVKQQIEYIQMQHCLIRLKEVASANIPIQEKKELITLLSELINVKYGSWQTHEMYKRQKEASLIHRKRMSIVEHLLLPAADLPKEEDTLKQLIKVKIDKNTK